MSSSIPPIGSIFSFIFEELSIAFQALFGGGPDGDGDYATRGLMLVIFATFTTMGYVIYSCSREKRRGYKYD